MRSIPARAGEPSTLALAVKGHTVYPRACGGTPNLPYRLFIISGLSPRVRGNPARYVPVSHQSRSIPARAGEPGYGRARNGIWRVYPRACGGTAWRRSRSPRCAGLSPRVRGNLLDPLLHPGPMRSIPARAGEPRRGCVRPRRGGVYPRACGGTMYQGDWEHLMRGLSPRVRGNRAPAALAWPRRGSIPARAGEPLLSRRAHHRPQVYPRACGGTRPALDNPYHVSGLSPRVRGNPVVDASGAQGAGSIPARAGEPHSSRQVTGLRRVYPRACGGTRCRLLAPQSFRGLSPRVRGNLLRIRHRGGGARSIPARAGEPVSSSASIRLPSVYPRACGGTGYLRVRWECTTGLSPRVRGNHPSGLPPAGYPGSIPARAGEPAGWLLPGWKTAVYPRACGGTSFDVTSVRYQAGLSPRVRGNRPARYVPVLIQRSIPARAGEPIGRPRQVQSPKVYPRACGGTGRCLAHHLVKQGLSPRVRGNHRETHS